ncbi:unnamed protein product [Caenorhabditis sp. 36 PRJEB53466]|nr:unnamed protein product [Caenorhabditis sp. 36 PRJEB53466]
MESDPTRLDVDDVIASAKGCSKRGEKHQPYEMNGYQIVDTSQVYEIYLTVEHNCNRNRTYQTVTFENLWKVPVGANQNNTFTKNIVLG